MGDRAGRPRSLGHRAVDVMRPVLVCGAGPVGLVTALLLARWGVPSTVLEAAPGPDVSGSRAICLQRDVLEVFDRIGCAAPMLAEGVTWSVGRTFYRDHELFTTTFPDPGGSPLPPWINLSQCSTERYLLDAVEASPLVDLRFDHRVIALTQDRAGVEVATGGGRRLRAAQVVAADGARSALRRLVGVRFPGHSFADQFLIADVRAELPFPNERRFHFDPEWNPGRQVLVHEQPDSVWRIDWQVPADFDLAAERASGALDARIRRIVGERPYEIVWLSVYRFHERVADEFRLGRVFLVGDAAHLFAPFGARGLNSGVQDAENLAWKLAAVHHGWVSGHDTERLLDSYSQERRPAALENLRVTNATMHFLVPPDEAARARRRQLLERAVHDAGARRLVDSGKLAEPYWYLDSPLTTPHPAAVHFPTAPGMPRPPVPGVLCPDAPCQVPEQPGVTRLRQLFGAGFVVLAARGWSFLPGTGIPATGYALPAIDPTGVVRQVLRAGTDSVYLVRPDGHLAAVLPRLDDAALVAALRRACGQHHAGDSE